MTNQPKRKLLQMEPPSERLYEPNGVKLNKGDEVRVLFDFIDLDKTNEDLLF